MQVFENLVILLCYFHKFEYSLADFTANLDRILLKLGQFSDKPVLFLGDFNCRVEETATYDSKTKELFKQAEQYGLQLANDPNIMTHGHPGWRGSAIDLIFYNKNLQLRQFSVKGEKEIKHHPVTCKFKLKNVNVHKSKMSAQKQKPVYKIDLEKLEFLVINNYVNMSKLLDNNETEAFYLHILDIIQKSKQTPRKSARKSKPWFDCICFLKRKELLTTYHSLIMCNFENTALVEKLINIKKEYKTLLKNKRLDFNKRQEDDLILQAEQEAYLFLKQPVEMYKKVQNPIDLEEWIKHMAKILNCEKLKNDDNLDLASLLQNYDENITCEPISDVEILVAVHFLKNKKAPGPDLLTNENIKALTRFMLPLFNQFFNKCLTSGKIPKLWKYSTMKLLYKNKGRTDDCNSYRGICLSNTLCKLLDKILSRRILEKFKDIIPQEQYGFMPGKSTIDAAKKFQNKISETLAEGKGKKLYAIYIDLTKAFDLSNRKILMQKIVEKKKLSKTELNLLMELLDLDFISINDGISESEPFVQSNGFKQGMNSSPLLFNIYIYDIVKIFEGIEGVEFLFYADDMVFVSEDVNKIKEVMRKFTAYAKENYLKPNYCKTKMMKFTTGGTGRYSKHDTVTVDGHEIEYVKSFPYLGIYFHRSGFNFTEHIEQRAKNSVTAMNMYGDLRKLSIRCAKKLFNLKFSPMASYGLEVVWPHLKVSDFEKIEKVKSRYFKKVMGVSKYNKNTYTYRLVEEDLFVRELRQRFDLPETNNYVNFVAKYEATHVNNFNEKYLGTPAVRDQVWKQPLFENRHVFCRFAMHGFHNQICSNTTEQKQCFQESDTCKCNLCGQKCTQYHLSECKKRVNSINAYAIKSTK
jgi:hypothetical protein